MAFAISVNKSQGQSLHRCMFAIMVNYTLCFSQITTSIELRSFFLVTTWITKQTTLYTMRIYCNMPSWLYTCNCHIMHFNSIFLLILNFFAMLKNLFFHDFFKSCAWVQLVEDNPYQLKWLQVCIYTLFSPLHLLTKLSLLIHYNLVMNISLLKDTLTYCEMFVPHPTHMDYLVYNKRYGGGMAITPPTPPFQKGGGPH